MKGLDGTVYEALGRYIDELCRGNFVGAARGKVVIQADGEYYPTPQEGTLPFLNIFRSDEGLLLIGVWGDEGIVLRMGMWDTTVRNPETVEVLSEIKDGVVARVTLRAGRSLANALGKCRERTEKKEGLVLSTRLKGRILPQTRAQLL